MKLDYKQFLRHLSFVGCSILCAYEVEQVIEKLLKKETSTHISYEEFGNHGIPSFTICAYSDHLGPVSAYNHQQLREHGLSVDKYVKDGVWWSNISGVTPEQLYENITWTINDLVDRGLFIQICTTDWLAASNNSFNLFFLDSGKCINHIWFKLVGFV